MSTARLKRALVPSIALLVVAAALMIAGSAVTSVAKAAPQDRGAWVGAAVQTRDAIIEFGDPVRIAEDERVQTVISFGGDVTVAGTVTQTVVAFGGDVRILPTARVGGALTTQSDPSIVAMGGTITVAEGARVTGEVQRIDEGNWSELVNVPVPHIDATWSGFSFLGWLVQTAIFLVLGLVAAALMPRQMLAVGRALSLRAGSSFGWGALTFFIIVPAAALVLLISIIGIPLLIPAVVAVPLFYFFVTVSVAAFIAQKLIAGKGRAPNLMLATALGVVGTTIASRVPVAGSLALLAMTLFGTGAAILAMVEWRRARKMTAAPAPTGGPAGGPVMHTATPYATGYAVAAQPTWETPPLAAEPTLLAASAGHAEEVTAVTSGETPTVVQEPARETPTVAEAPAPVPEFASATPVASRRRFQRRLPEAPAAAEEEDQTPPASEL